MAYLIVMSAPEAMLSLGTLAMEMLDGELSPTGKSHHNDGNEISPQDTGHLPQDSEVHSNEPQKLLVTF